MGWTPGAGLTELWITQTVVLPLGLLAGTLLGHTLYREHARIRLAPLVVMLYAWLGALVPLVSWMKVLQSEALMHQLSYGIGRLAAALLLLTLVAMYWMAVLGALRCYKLIASQARHYAWHVLLGCGLVVLLWGLALPNFFVQLHG